MVADDVKTFAQRSVVHRLDTRRRPLRSTTVICGTARRPAGAVHEEDWVDEDSPALLPDQADGPDAERVLEAVMPVLDHLAGQDDVVSVTATVVDSLTSTSRGDGEDLIVDRETYAAATLIWQPSGPLGAHGRRITHARVAPDELGEAVAAWPELRRQPPIATGVATREQTRRWAERLPTTTLTLEPYAVAQLLDRLVPYLVEPGHPTARAGLVGLSQESVAQVHDLVAYGGGTHRRFDDTGRPVVPLVVWSGRAPVTTLGAGHGRLFRDTHRGAQRPVPTGLVLTVPADPDGGTTALPDSDLVVHKLQQLRTGGGADDVVVRCVLGAVTQDGLFVRIPGRIDVRRLLPAVVAAQDDQCCFALAHRVYGTRVALAAGAVTP